MSEIPARSSEAAGKAPSGGDFPATSWSLVLGVQASATQERRRALDGLCRRYWKPIYTFARRAWSKSHEEAEELCQAFFVWLLEKEPLDQYQPDSRGFRPYLKMLIRRFEANRHDALNAWKRGGRVKFVSIDGGPEPILKFLPDFESRTPEEASDLAYVNSIMEPAIDRTRAWFQNAKRELQFRVFEACVFAPGEKPTYADLAARFGVTTAAVRNYIHEVRERLRTELRQELSNTVADPEQLEEEWKALFGE